MITAPILRQADDTKLYVLKTDASSYALGAALVQGEGEGEHPVEYASRLLTSAERNYSTTEHAALAVIWSLNKFRGYVECLPVIIITDHQISNRLAPAFAKHKLRHEYSNECCYLTFGRELRTPDDNARDLRQIIMSENFVPEITPKLLQMDSALQHAKEINEDKEERRKLFFDEKRRPSPQYKPGDLVLATTHTVSSVSRGVSAKLAPRRDGPYIILQSHGPTSYEIADPEKPDTPVGIYHASALTHYHGETTVLPTPLQPVRRRGRPKLQNTETTKPSSTQQTARRRGRPKKLNENQKDDQHRDANVAVPHKNNATPRMTSTKVLPSSPGRLRRQKGRL